jgi:type I restriction enzyme R subunit
MKYENTFKAIDQILWKEQGCGSELDYLEQKSWMLFLKYLDDLETEREDEAGFAEEKLNLLKDMLKMQKCDLFDVLEYIAYDSTPIERAKRVELVKRQYVDSLSKEQQEFDNLILQYYVKNGFKELGSDKLKTFINIQYNSMNDAKEKLNMTASGLREHYFELQRRLYSA